MSIERLNFSFFFDRVRDGGKRVFLPLVFVLLFFQLFSQQLSFKHLTAADGLSSEIINSMTEDRFGRIWMATENGLNVFDGYEVKTFNRTEGSGLLSNYISAVLCDSSGRLWIASEGGINYMEENNNRFVQPTTEGGIQITSCNTIRLTLTYGPVFSTPQGYFFFDETAGKLQKIGWLSGLIQPELLRVKARERIKDDQHVFILPDKFLVVDLAAQKIIFSHNDRNVRAVQSCGDNELMVIKYTAIGLYRIRTSTGEVTRYEDSTDSDHRKISAVFSDIIPCGANTLALASRYSGLYFYDGKNNRFTNYRHDPSNTQTISSDYNRSLYYSKKGFLFVATFPLSYCNLRELPFKSVRSMKDDQGLINDDVVNCFAEDTLGNIWIGTNSALVKWNPATGSSSFYNYVMRQPTVVFMNTIRGVTIDRKQRVWVSTYGGGIGILDEQKGIFKKLTPNQNDKYYSLPSSDGSSIECDRYGYLWVSTPGGICKVDPATFAVENFLTHPKMKSVAGLATFNHFFDSNENLWLGTRKGAWCYNRNLDSVVHLQWADKERGNEVYSFAEDNAGNIYIGTGDGLHIVHLQTGRRTTIKTEQGLPSNRILGLLTDDEGNVWFSAANGLGKIIPGNMGIETYDSRYGVLMSDHKEESYYKTKKGIIFMGCQEGFNYFNPTDVKPSEYDLQTFIMDISYGDSIAAVNRKSAFKLAYSENTISFRYLAIDYQYAPIIQYQYQLQGLDTSWIPAGKQREVRYANLPPGKYSFLVRASTDGKNWTPGKNVVVLRVVAPIWMRWWFIAALAGLIFFGLYKWITALRKRIRSEKILNYFATSLYGQNTVEDIFRDIAKNCITQLNFPNCLIYQYDEQREVFIQKAADGPKNTQWNEIANPIEIPIGKGITGSVAASGKAEIVADTSKDKRYIINDCVQLSEITVPIMVDGRVFGIIDSVHPKKNFYSREDLKLMEKIADVCASKISKYLVEEKLRTKIARDLHDEMGSTLTSINIISKMAMEQTGENKSQRAHLEKIKEYSGRMMESMSDMVWAINPANDTLDKMILRMKEVAAEILEPARISYFFRGDSGLGIIKLNPEQRKDLFLLYKEALTNAVKYSTASEININLERQNGFLTMCIGDNGKGFDTSVTYKGNGLKNMRSRATQLRAELDIHSGNGEGTVIRIRFPIT